MSPIVTSLCRANYKRSAQNSLISEIRLSNGLNSPHKKSLLKKYATNIYIWKTKMHLLILYARAIGVQFPVKIAAIVQLYTSNSNSTVSSTLYSTSLTLCNCFLLSSSLIFFFSFSIYSIWSSLWFERLKSSKIIFGSITSKSIWLLPCEWLLSSFELVSELSPNDSPSLLLLSDFCPLLFALLSLEVSASLVRRIGY